MKKGLKTKISSLLTAIVMSGSFVFAPVGLGGLDVKPLFSLRDPGTAQELSYDTETSKYYIGGEEAEGFPTSGDYILTSDVPIKSIFTVSAPMSIDLGGYDLLDNATGSKNTLITVDSTTFTLSDSTFDLSAGTGGSLKGTASDRRAFEIVGTGTLNITSGYVDGFKTSQNGGAVFSNSDKATLNFSGGVIRNCKSSHSSGGGGIFFHEGTCNMSGYACVTACETTCTGAEKSGNGAGVSIATHSHCYISGHVSITNCKATGYHGAGIDFWGSNYSCTLTISGSPTITGNMCGRGYECNLYCGKSINVGDLELTRENGEVVPQVGITIQQFPIFTSGASANNDEDIEDLAKFFYADRKSAPTSIVPNASIYDIEPADNTELKQTPTIKVNLYVPSISGEDGYKLITTLEGVPMGYISNLSTYNVSNHSNNGWNTEKGKFKSNFNNQTLTGHEDFNLYAVVLPKVNGHSLSCFEDGSIGMSIYISYDEDLGIIDSSATVKISNLTVNPNESDTIAVDPTNIKTVGNNKYVVVTYKFNPYDMTRNISETVTYSNGYSQKTSGQPNVVAGGILNGKGYGNDQKSAAAKQLASSMLVFGSRLQTQLGYYMNSSNELAEDAYTSKIMYHDPISSVPNVPEKSVVDDTSNALTFYGSSVVYNTNIEIKQYIKLNGESASDYTYAIDGEGDYAFETDNSGKYIFARIKVPAYSMDKSYEVTVKDGSGTTVLTIDYSIYNYIDSVITNKQGTAVYDTVQSLYWYGVDAKAYAGVA